MGKTIQSSCPVVVVMVMMVTMMAVVMVVSAASVEDDACQLMRGECRRVTWMTDGALTRNISCYCKYGEEVSGLLHELSDETCMNEAAGYVNTSIVHIVGCRVSSKFPESLLGTCRASRHLVLHVQDSPLISFASPSPRSPDLSSFIPSTVTATFINSKVSGLAEGVVSGAGQRATVVVEGGEISVIENHAFSGYPSHAHVSLTFRDTSITTVMQKAFDLPPAAQMEVTGSRVVKFDHYSYSGGAELTLSGVVVANLLSSAINIYGLKKLNVTNCTIASVYADALDHRYPTYIRNVTGGDHVLEGSEAVFADNAIMEGNGQAFAQLCTVASLVWRNNTVLTTSDMPLRLQGPTCSTQRDWRHVFTLTGLICHRCSDFAHPDPQTCAMYESGYCVTCEGSMDECNESILPYLLKKCATSDPDIAKALNDTCIANAPTTRRTSKALQIQDRGASASLAPLVQMVMTLGVAVYLAAP